MAAFDARLGLYRDLADAAHDAVGKVLRAADIQIHSITRRAKTRESFAAKIRRPDKGYSQLSDVTDLAGVRVTTYFVEDVDHVSRALHDAFAIDQQQSIDRRKFEDPSRFGYSSLHYVARFGGSRAELPENRRFSELTFEIQIRSILQHAWAEIEHDLGYKSAGQIPAPIRRKFAESLAYSNWQMMSFVPYGVPRASMRQKCPPKSTTVRTQLVLTGSPFSHSTSQSRIPQHSTRS